MIRSTLFRVLLSILSGIFLYIAWPLNGYYPFLFIGIVPLFYILELSVVTNQKRNNLVLFVCFFLAHFLWIGLSLSWLNDTSPKTYLTAITLESLSISFALLPTVLVRKKFGKLIAISYFICAWMAVEYFNQHSMLGTPYFLLGSGFGMNPELIQFYTYSGVEGGSLLVLLVNGGVFLLVEAIRSKSPSWKPTVFILLLLSPFGFSRFLPAELAENKKIHIVALHSNIETYTDENHQFPERMITYLWKQSKTAISPNTELLIWPETIVSNLGWISNFSGDKAFKTLDSILREYPQLTICTGGYAFSTVSGKEDVYARFSPDFNLYYNTHNIAYSTSQNRPIQFRSKDIFIPFQERIPLLNTFPWMRNFADLVGANTMVSPFPQDQEIHRTSKGTSYAPILCFESIYPIFLSEKAKDAEFICILANEYWNRNLAGSDQYLHVNVGIAIQNRITIVRSSNSGKSAIIDRNGKITKTRSNVNPGSISEYINLKSGATFYESISGLIYQLCIFISSLLILLSIFKKKITKN